MIRAAIAFVIALVSLAAFAQDQVVREARYALPKGTYQTTCNVDTCMFDGQILSCECLTSARRSYWSSLNWGGSNACCVGNDESRLYCESPRRYCGN